MSDADDDVLDTFYQLDNYEISDKDIAIIGMSGRFPKAADLRQFWRNLEAGVEAVTFLSDDELLAAGVPAAALADPSYVKAASMLESVEEFDAGFFGYTPREAEIMDPQQRLFLEHAWQALENAGYRPGGFDGLIGVYAGVAWNTYLLSNLTRHPELFAGGGGFQVFITNDKDFMPTRVSYKLNLKGPSMIVQTSCSTSLVAVHLACLSLLNYECDLALVGGVTVKVPQREGYFYLEGGLASPDGHCRSFDADAAGTIFGSGIGMVVLKRLEEALADGDSIRAVIKGSAINNDGSVKVSYTAPSVEGQAEVVAAAQQMAGIDPRSVGYIEAHGTGTSLGDPIEVTALTKVFRASTPDVGFCGLGSVKSNLGHLDAAAGIAGLLKTTLALEHQVLPPSLGFERPNPKSDLENSPFFVVTQAQPWQPAPDAPRRAGVSSFGVGGTNAHVIVQEAPPQAAPAPSRPWQLLLLSARSPAALDAASQNLAETLRQPQTPDLADVAYTLQRGREVFRHRRMLVVESAEQAADALAGTAAASDAAIQPLTAEDSADPRSRPVAFLFSGQGAQYPGMGEELYHQEAVFRDEVDRCCRLLQPHLGLDLRTVLYPGPETDADEAAARLQRTELAQPALFVVEYALARLWQSWGIEPWAMLGHSVGEYVAACLADVFTLEDALRLVALRGKLMGACPPGAMTAVPLAEADVLTLLAEATGKELSLAAVNEAERCVVAGPTPAIETFEHTLAERGITCRRLHTSHAFHSAMMDSALGPFTDPLRRLRLNPPKRRYVSNLTGTWITPEEATDPAYWARHLRQSVRFAAGLDTLLAEPEVVLLEVGPGRTLTTLAQRHPRSKAAFSSLRHPQDAGSDLAFLLTTLGRLWLAGREIDWPSFYGDEPRRRVPLPTYPFERQRYWIEPGTTTLTSAVASASAPAAGGTGDLIKATDPAAWFYRPSWQLAASPVPASAEPQRWLLLHEPAAESAEANADEPASRHTSLATTLATQLRARGWQVIDATPGTSPGGDPENGFHFDAGSIDGYQQLLDAVLAGGPLHGILHLGLLGTTWTWKTSRQRGYLSLRLLAQALGRVEEEAPLRLEVLASNLLAVTETEPLAPGKAPILGLLQVIPQELPQIRCRALDVLLPPPGSAMETSLATHLADDLAADPATGEDAIAWRGSQRWRQTYQPLPLPPAKLDLGPQPAVLITGGLEGNGLGLARHLAATTQVCLALLMDAELPPRERWPEVTDPRQATWLRHAQELEAQGNEVLVLGAPLSDPAAVSRAVGQACQHFGNLQAVIHAATAAEDQTFRPLDETDAEVDAWHFGPKAEALMALDLALDEHHQQPTLCVLVASLAGVLGGLGYAAYAAANRFLDAWAHESRRTGDRAWISVDWDAWQLDGDAQQVT